MNAKNFFTLRLATLLVTGAALVLPGLRAAEADAMPKFDDNYLKLSGTVPSLSGSHAAFQNRTQISKKGAGGIEEFDYTADLSKETNFKFEGRALPGAEDYLAEFKLTKNEVGSFGAGYKRARTFYDGAGGFFPINNAWLPIYPRALYVDRGSFFVDATIALPQQPVFTFSYRNDTRTGRKDSTIMGDTDLTGIPIYRPTSLNLVSSNRKLVPAFINLNERNETWEAMMKHHVGATEYQLAVIGTRINNNNVRSVDRYPGELSPRPALPSNPVPPIQVSPYLVSNQNKGFDQQGVKEDGYTVLGKIETKLNDQAKLFLSGSYNKADTDVASSRLITAYILTDTGLTQTVGGYTPAGRSPYSYVGTGSLTQEIWTGVFGTEWKPTKDLELTAGVKGEHMKSSGNFQANYVLNMITLTTGAIAPQSLSAPNTVNNSEKPWTPEASVRYSGIPNVVLWGKWDYRTTTQDERTSYVGLTTGTAAMVLTAPTGAMDNVKEKHTNLTLGANWTPNALLMVRGEVFKKDHENNFTGYGTALGGFYILDYDTYGARVTATVKPAPEISFSTRYLVERGKADIAEDGFLYTNANDARRYQLSETIDWNPNKSVYVQGNLCLFWDTIGTVYPRAGGTANDVLHNADNNFWNASVVTGYVVDKNTDATIQGTCYKANNWNPGLAAATTPYGQGGRDYSVTVGVKHKFSERVVGDAKLGYFNSNNETSGGFSNYKGTVGYVSLQFKL